jgi:protease I
VRDGNLLSSRGPQDLVPFVRDMIQLYAGGPPSNGALRRRHSDAQRERPPTLVSVAMGWMPRSSMGTLFGIALFGAGMLAASRNRAGTGEPQAALR